MACVAVHFALYLQYAEAHLTKTFDMEDISLVIETWVTINEEIVGKDTFGQFEEFGEEIVNKIYYYGIKNDYKMGFVYKQRFTNYLELWKDLGKTK